ncbi:MAG: prepilin signal peptidase PulO-like enzyme (type II secretory pathway) [Rickettsiales bacterium]|jgi:prepilin signal peptidase PulO-like enzyme (type II secretory pathway)
MLDLLGLFAAGIFGAIFGSYSTLFAYRLPIGESCFGRYFGPKSRCPSCNTIIRTRELIPIFNWLFTLGRCVTCKTKIPKTYLFIELATTALFMICYWQFSFSEQFIIYAALCAACVVIVATDYSSKIFPNQALNVILIAGLINRVLIDGGIIDIVFSVAIGVVFASVFYQLFHKKFSSFLTSEKQSLGYAKFIVIVSVCLNLNDFLLYFLSVCLIVALLIISAKSLKQTNKSLGFSLVVPFLWLMLNF